MPPDTTPDRPRRRPPAPEGPWKTSADAADYLGISRRQIYRLMKARLLAFSMVGERRRISVAELERYARRRKAS